MSIVKLKDNHRMTISLKYLTPKETPNAVGMEYLYRLSTGAQIYVSAQGHAEIQALNPLPGEDFTLARIVGAGNAVTWSVERIAQPDIPAPKPMAAARSISLAAVAPPPSLTTRESIRIFNQLVATIQAVKAAEEFSLSIGRPVKFGPEDIRAMGISGFIEQSRRAA